MLTPVDPPLRVGSAVIATDPVMEVDKAELIPMKQVVRLFVIDLTSRAGLRPGIRQSQF